MKLTEQLSNLHEVVETLQIGDEFFWEPLRLVRPGAWTGHLATAFWLTKAVKPRIFVELGTHSGNSYSAFCQAIALLGLPTRAFAVDTWQGDEHAGLYDESVWNDLNAFNELHFAGFSKLLRSTFDDARGYFADDSIDLLHIDGLHTYEAVKHDFETWKTAASSRAVVVFHDTNVRERGFGVWKLWQELAECYPAFEFHHSEGLGVLGVGKNQSPLLSRLFEMGRDADTAAAVRRLFASRGETFKSRAYNLELTYAVSELSGENGRKSQRLSELEQELTRRDAAARDAVLDKEQQIQLQNDFIRDKEREIQLKDGFIREREQIIQLKSDLVREREHEVRLKNDFIAEREKVIQLKDQLIREREGALQLANETLRQAQQDVVQVQQLAGSAQSELARAQELWEAEKSDRNQDIGKLEQSVADLTRIQAALSHELQESKAERQRLQAELDTVLSSRTWRYTSGVRRLKQRLGGRRTGPPSESPQLQQDRQIVASSGFFDSAWYLSQNPDVASAAVDPLTHYLEFGGVELRDPGPKFSIKRYLEQNPDVHAAGVNPLLHYVQFGIAEGRRAFPAVDQEVVEATASSVDVFSYMSTPIDVTVLPKKVFVGVSSLGNFFMTEIARTLEHAFRQLGVESVLVNQSEACSLPAGIAMVAVAPHEFFHLGDGPKAFELLKRNSRMVMVNTEQPQTQWFALAQKYMKSAVAVLDINFESARHLHQSGHLTFALPLGYSDYIARTFDGKHLPAHDLHRFMAPETIGPLPATYGDRPIDVLFIGTASPRRHEFFARNAAFFSSKNTILYLPDGHRPFLPGDRRTVDFATVAALVKRSKILLNVHRDDVPYLEWQRIVTLGIMQGTLVITDHCRPNPCITPNLDYLEGPLDALPMLCEMALSNTVATGQFASGAYDRLKKNYPMEQVLGRCWTALAKAHGGPL